MRHFFALGAFVAAATAAAFAAALVPSTIVADPTTYNGKTVTVTGMVSNFQTSTTAAGNVVSFQLCDSKCVVVIDKTNHPESDGSQVTVTGTFHATLKGTPEAFTNAVVIEDWRICEKGGPAEAKDC
jgi:cytochrome c-type biogenesis protein CcmE